MSGSQRSTPHKQQTGFRSDTMKNRTVRLNIMTAALFLAALSIGTPLIAQIPFRVNTSGTAFSPQGRADQNPGEFLLTAVGADFPRKPLTGTTMRDRDVTVRSPGLSNEPTHRLQGSPVLQAMPSGAIYALTTNNDLLWYRHSGWEDGSSRWAVPEGKTVGTGWTFKHVFSGGEGVIYAVTANGDLLWFRHDGYADGSVRWAAPEGKKVGTGWRFKQLFSASGGVIYAITASGDLLWYRHDGRDDGSVRWAASHGKTVGTVWTFKEVFSGDSPGS